MRSVKRLVSLMLALCLLLGCAAAEGVSTPSDITPPVTERPTDTPPQTAPPTQAPTAELTAPPTATPTAQPVVVLTEKPWDESTCQHNTADCEQAPKCGTAGCPHITQDAHGLDIPACALGEWLLDAQDNPRVMPISVRANVIDLNVANATIYRSGTYRVKGGNLRAGASVSVAKNRVVILELEDVTVATLTAGQGSLLQIKTTGQNKIATLKTTGDNAVIFVQGGALTIDAVEAKEPEKNKITFEVKGGSLRAPLTEKSGLTQFAFPAQGATGVTVDGAAYAATPHDDGMAYLWLPAPDAGMKWTSAVTGATLAVSQTADLPQSASGIEQGKNNALEANKTYVLSGDVSDGTSLTITQSGVTVVLSSARATGTLIDASAAYTLHVTGESSIESLAGSGAVTLQGDGQLTVTGTLPANVSFRSGRYLLANVPGGYMAVDAGYPLKNQSVTVNGAAYPLLTNLTGSLLLLPELPAGKAYAVTADETAVTVRAVNGGEKAYTLTQAAPNVDAGSASAFTVAGDGSVVTGSIRASGATAAAAFHNVRLQGNASVLTLSGERLTVTLTGDNSLQSASGKAIALSSDAALALNVASGRLVLKGQDSLTGITLRGNVLVEPASSLPHTVLVIRDKNGNPVRDRDLTVSIGGQTWQYTTHADGSLHLWGLGDISGKEIAATDGENVYTAVVMNNQAQLTTGLTDFSDVTFSSQADGSLLISWAVPGAGTTGVQLLYGKAAVDMPDTYVAGAQHIVGKDFSAKVTGIPAGSVVTVRVYATQASGVAFNEQTADGFQFGEIFTYVHRLPWKYVGEAGAADAFYTGKAYQSKISVPGSATVTYSGRDLVNGKPVYPGDYVMKVTIPEGDPTYLPGTVEIPFTIKKAIVTIQPGYNLQKYAGFNDPEFTWTVRGLLDGDTVTGVLTREAGEDPGEYRWLTRGFNAADYYELRIDPDAEPFLILPVMGMIQVNEVMHPVEQTITLRDGRKLIVLLNAQDSLTVTHSVLGNLVRNEEDKPRLFTPQLSWNPETDEVLLMLRAEPEMNEDHGYQTDAAGNPLWGTRVLWLNGYGLEHMDRMGITALTLINKDASLTCRIEDFLTDEMAELIEEAGGTLSGTNFLLTVEPVQEAPDGLRPVTAGWRMSAVMLVKDQTIDVTSMLPNLTVAVDMEPVADLLTELERYDEERFPEQFALSLDDGTALESVFIEPFAEDELEKAAFPTMMYIDRYLSAPLTAPGTVYAVNAPETEAVGENATASAE